MRLDIDNPRPIPFALVVKKGVQIMPVAPSEMQVPVSLKVTCRLFTKISLGVLQTWAQDASSELRTSGGVIPGTRIVWVSSRMRSVWTYMRFLWIPDGRDGNE